MDSSIHVLNTARWVAERPSVHDYTELCRLYADERVMATLGGVRDEAEVRARLEYAIEHWDQYGFGWWMLRDRRTGDCVGRGGLQRVRVLDADEVEVLYALHAEYWGQGLATELAQVSVQVAFEQVGLTELVAFALVGNHASRRVMEKVGFSYARDFERDGMALALYRLGSTLSP